MAFEGFEHGKCVKVPEFDGAVVGGGKEGAGGGVNAHGVDPIGVAAEGVAGVVFEIPDYDRMVHRACC